MHITYFNNLKWASLSKSIKSCNSNMKYMICYLCPFNSNVFSKMRLARCYMLCLYFCLQNMESSGIIQTWKERFSDQLPANVVLLDSYSSDIMNSDNMIHEIYFELNLKCSWLKKKFCCQIMLKQAYSIIILTSSYSTTSYHNDLSNFRKEKEYLHILTQNITTSSPEMSPDIITEQTK